MNYQLGYLCRSDNINHPRKVYFMQENKYADNTSISDVSISERMTLGITSSGELYMWGIEYDGKGYRITPDKLITNFNKDIEKSDVLLTQAEYNSLIKMGKIASQYYEKLKEDSEMYIWSKKQRKSNDNKFSINPEYCLTKIVVHKVACSNKHSLIVILQ